jgi:linoleoyl-CoA desaturase
MQKVKFVNKEQASFFATLRKNVDLFFQENNLDKTGGTKLIVKALIMFSLYFIPYFVILFANLNGIQNLILCFVMGIGVSGIGMSVMHDAIHGSFSNKTWVNKLFGSSLYFLGGNVYNWEVQHNQLHHTYTNIHDLDEDITGKFLLRLNVAEKKKWIHRLQHIYAFFLYSLMTLSFLWKDFKEIRLFNELSKEGIVKPYPKKQLLILILTKIAYFVFILVVPMVLLDLTFGQWFLGFMVMHCTSGIILSVIFQLAHVVDEAEQPIPSDTGTLENSWAVHQLKTTSNFFGSSKLLSWYIGGLDYQIEHHLFPKISHVYYDKISDIVAKTAKEYGLEYNSKGGFFTALSSHINMLKKLGVSQNI